MGIGPGGNKKLFSIVNAGDLHPVVNPHHPGVFGAIGAAVDFLARLHAVPDHLASTMAALGSQRVNGALETVVMMGFPLDDNLNRLVVIVAAYFAFHTHKFDKPPGFGRTGDNIRISLRRLWESFKRFRVSPSRQSLYAL